LLTEYAVVDAKQSTLQLVQQQQQQQLPMMQQQEMQTTAVAAVKEAAVGNKVASEPKKLISAVGRGEGPDRLGSPFDYCF
jgi:hypothetical protein